ncbi:hypothetical protein [Pseudomarimonas arenosa]|uniref:DUF4154 domain-containing protein n=1 Tax=Pseudomarimonas arenosa TaxID=2774145 RepID=A0AAW3ZI72_9GAMM|nr:hypothetical protein [Pseudomarimonas arenosa]MBD8524832.1 hypothetical protein [Pseudomarimonas arenosa]
MRAVRRPRRPWAWLLICGLALSLGLAGAKVQADSYDDRRVRTAARLMRALLSADEQLPSKQSDEGLLEVWVWSDRPRDAEPLLPLIAPPGNGPRALVRGMKIQLSLVSDLPDAAVAAPMAIFLAQPLDDPSFARLLAWCIEHGVILYSPFEGDVERGATAGVSVQAKVQPFVNLSTLRSSGIILRQFYLDHSRAQP